MSLALSFGELGAGFLIWGMVGMEKTIQKEKKKK